MRKVSPSQFKRLLAKQGLGKGAETYADEIVQALLGFPVDEYTSKEMQWGIDNEDFARMAYEAKTFSEVIVPKKNGKRERKTHPKHKFITGEIDGLVGDKGGIEIKCPNSNNHYKNLAYNEQVDLYMPQMQGYIWIYELDWIDFVSFNPEYPKKYRTHIVRVNKDQEMINLIESRCIEFWNEMVQPKLEILKNRFK